MQSADISRTQFALALLLILLVAAGLRFVFPVADPPARPTVGIVWHDEGAWVHNARNRALFGAWKLDEWNPMYVTPVLTGLEYLAFRAFGVGLRQARLVPGLLGLLSVWLIGLGVARVANRSAGLIAAALLATSFVYVMYNRAATIEATMVAFLVVSWYAYARAGGSARWGLVAGFAAILAYFTKASAVFFVAALGLEALLSLVQARARARSLAGSPASEVRAPSSAFIARAALYTIGGLAVASVIALAVFVLPNWHEYRFYNWQISVTRKPSYAPRAFVDRASLLPISADFFTRIWLVLVLASTAALGRLAVLGKLAPAERLLLWWTGLGIAELVVHDIQERRLLFLVPPLIALAAIALGRDRRLASVETCALSWQRALWAAPLVMYVFYMLVAPVVRLPFMVSVQPGEHAAAIVRVAAACAVVLTAALFLTWRSTTEWLRRQQWPLTLSILLASLAVAADLGQFVQWAAGRSYKNYEAMVLIGRTLPPGTLVHGKLANGLDLENTIRPVFVGRGFGNYEDRTRRDDVRYLVTYISPFLGYEGGRDASGRPIIRDVLDAYPHARALKTFPLCESDEGNDRGALIDKMPGRR